MMDNRSIFALNGITGMLIAVVLLLSIVGVLTYFSVVTQAANASNYYKIENEKEIKMFSTENAKHLVDAK
jgi:hypothetical protein